MLEINSKYFSGVDHETDPLNIIHPLKSRLHIKKSTTKLSQRSNHSNPFKQSYEELNCPELQSLQNNIKCQQITSPFPLYSNKYSYSMHSSNSSLKNSIYLGDSKQIMLLNTPNFQRAKQFKEKSFKQNSIDISSNGLKGIPTLKPILLSPSFSYQSYEQIKSNKREKSLRDSSIPNFSNQINIEQQQQPQQQKQLLQQQQELPPIEKSFLQNSCHSKTNSMTQTQNPYFQLTQEYSIQSQSKLMTKSSLLSPKSIGSPSNNIFTSKKKSFYHPFNNQNTVSAEDQTLSNQFFVANICKFQPSSVSTRRSSILLPFPNQMTSPQTSQGCLSISAVEDGAPFPAFNQSYIHNNGNNNNVGTSNISQIINSQIPVPLNKQSPKQQYFMQNELPQPELQIRSIKEQSNQNFSPTHSSCSPRPQQETEEDQINQQHDKQNKKLMKAVANYFISKEYLIASKQHISPKKARIYLYGKEKEKKKQQNENKSSKTLNSMLKSNIILNSNSEVINQLLKSNFLSLQQEETLHQ